jgi:hypothetical protein
MMEAAKKQAPPERIIIRPLSKRGDLFVHAAIVAYRKTLTPVVAVAMWDLY